MPPTEPRVRAGSARAVPKPLLVAALVLLAARIAFGVAHQTERAPREDLVRWRAPGPTAEAEAMATGKPLLYDFMAEWCGPCRTMQDEVFADPTMAAKLEAMYVPVRVLDQMREVGRNLPPVEALQKMYRVDAFPTLVVASPDGTRHETLQGYRGAFATSQWLARALLEVMGKDRPAPPGMAPDTTAGAGGR